MIINLKSTDKNAINNNSYSKKNFNEFFHEHKILPPYVRVFIKLTSKFN